MGSDVEAAMDDELGEGVDEELEAMKSKVKEMEDEAEKLRKIMGESEDQLAEGGEGTGEEGAEADGRSVYVGNVDYSATPEELQELFEPCGTVNRITILCDRYKNPKGYAYVEFADSDAIDAAVALAETEFKGRQLKVVAKRTNVPGMGKGKGGRGKGKGRGGYGYRGRGGKGKGWGKGGGYGPWRHGGRGKGYRPY